MPTSFQVRASLVEVPLLSTSTNDRCGFRVERLPPPSPLSLSPTPLLRHGVGRSGFTCTRKLSLTAPLLSAVNPKPPLAFPSRRCRDAALTSSISHGCHTNRHILPTPYRKKPPTFHAPGSFHYPSAKLTPPQAPMGGAPPDCFTSAMSATASLTPSYLRLRARAGRLTVCGASSSTESLSLRCATRHLPFALIPM